MTESSVDPRVFISYSWDSDEHKEWVWRFASELRAHGVNARLDKWHLRAGESITYFMESEIAQSDFIISICTHEFARKSNDRSGGVGYEQQIVSGRALSGLRPSKFIPVLRSGSSTLGRDYAIPSHFAGIAYINMKNDSEFTNKLEEVLRVVHSKPKYVEPPIGPVPDLPADSNPSSFSHTDQQNHELSASETNATGSSILPRSRIDKVSSVENEDAASGVSFSKANIPSSHEIEGAEDEKAQKSGDSPLLSEEYTESRRAALQMSGSLTIDSKYREESGYYGSPFYDKSFKQSTDFGGYDESQFCERMRSLEVMSDDQAKYLASARIKIKENYLPFGRLKRLTDLQAAYLSRCPKRLVDLGYPNEFTRKQWQLLALNQTGLGITCNGQELDDTMLVILSEYTGRGLDINLVDVSLSERQAKLLNLCKAGYVTIATSLPHSGYYDGVSKSDLQGYNPAVFTILLGSRIDVLYVWGFPPDNEDIAARVGASHINNIWIPNLRLNENSAGAVAKFGGKCLTVNSCDSPEAAHNLARFGGDSLELSIANDNVDTARSLAGFKGKTLSVRGFGGMYSDQWWTNESFEAIMTFNGELILRSEDLTKWQKIKYRLRR